MAGLSPGSLAGLRVLITRPGEQGEQAAVQVQQAGGEPILCPCLELRPAPQAGALAEALAEAPEIVVVTSVHAVDGLTAVRPDLGAALAGAFVAAVGDKTAAALRGAGVRVDLVATQPGAEGLFAALRQVWPNLAGRRVLFPRADQGREELVERLRAAGAVLRLVTAYAMVPRPVEQLAVALSALRTQAVDLVPLTSPRTAQVLLDALGPEGPGLLAHCAVGAIGQTTAAALRTAGVRVDVVAPDASFPQLLTELARHRRQSSLPAGT
ncbi:MAG: uroporphyrinogen-III synthase [Myxococcales bacterium]|nr:uroporphyrinogen-III synthase [Myxococcota bacterium]MDW8283394.1 uroporphyrinogen-III synthase [Myxococcales bacterium]